MNALEHSFSLDSLGTPETHSHPSPKKQFTEWEDLKQEVENIKRSLAAQHRGDTRPSQFPRVASEPHLGDQPYFEDSVDRDSDTQCLMDTMDFQSREVQEG